MPQNHRTTEWLKLEVIWSKLSSSRDMKVECPGPHPGDFGRYPRRLHHLWATCASAVNHRAQNCFLMLRWKFLFQFVPIASCLDIRYHHCREPCTLPSNVYKHWRNAPEPLLSKADHSQSHMTGAPRSWWPSAGIPSVRSHHFCTGRPRTQFSGTPQNSVSYKQKNSKVTWTFTLSEANTKIH